MKTIIVSAFGDADVLLPADAPDPMPGAGQVLVHVEAIGVGLVDVFQRMGRYPGLTEPGFVPGLEVAGTVGKVGEGVDQAWLGRRVFAQVPAGGYADKALAAVQQLTPLPDGLSAKDAVALGINALVAELILDEARLVAGDQVLVRGAGGGIGVLAVQAAAARGATVAAVTSSTERGDRLKTLGAGAIVNRMAGPADPATTYDVILDPVAGPEVPAFLGRLKPGGRYVMVGFAGGLPTGELAMALVMNFQKSISLSTFSLNTVAPERLSALLAELFGYVAAGKLKPVIDAEFPLAQAADAHRKLEGGAFGKVVLIP